MKTLLTLFVLLFSSSVFAWESLKGIKLICIENERYIENIGIEFFSEEEVNLYFTYVNGEISNAIAWNYYALPEKILIGIDYSMIRYSINRKTLGFFTDEKFRAKCLKTKKSIKEELNSLIDSQIKKLKKDNKI